MSEYRIRVKPVVPWPKEHNGRKYWPTLPSNMADVTFILGVPEQPDPKFWHCGTDLVWPVICDEGADRKYLNIQYVCRHLIQIGD